MVRVSGSDRYITEATLDAHAIHLTTLEGRLLYPRVQRILHLEIWIKVPQ